MQKLNYVFEATKSTKKGLACTVGVVGSGNCEVLVNSNQQDKVIIDIFTSVDGFDQLWQAVCTDFVDEYKPEALSFTINDSGATPAVVALRLRQAMEVYHKQEVPKGSNYLELDARSRIASLFEDFEEFNCKNGCYSHHLDDLGITGQHDDGIVLGRANFKNKNVFVAAQQKDFIGGAVGEMHGAKLNALFKKAVKESVEAVILLIDSGGVRLHEANAGEIAISEIIRSILAARRNGVKTIGVICGKNGAYGGMGIIAATLDCRIVSEVSRMGVSGAEVIQAVKGIEAFDANDRALVWRVYGGKTRYLNSEVELFADNNIATIKMRISEALQKEARLDLKVVKVEQKLLKQRLLDSGDCREEAEYLNENNYGELADKIFDMNYSDFLKIAEDIKRS
ncbi:biotin-independent malonate decarboxylase subunit beta [Francisella sp. 19X1-34]|uniref:biotin-independent malonate decarboxylase subunit beta n=1 Tax=Francisella sp. 19X1-34 TaxID=3087177 RepID=UPI002E33D6E7|nr:biotin-independent malonate decarboxylase subunit beta [Francisella sp. 19X1-34]MED7787629.1 biotin-independent malonate decarboxylase subunit beta [Francisella sp. 19X1-34]